MDQRIIDKSLTSKGELRNFFGISPKTFTQCLHAMGFYEQFPSMKLKKILLRKHIVYIVRYMDSE
jgi:hypothetical protein